jgi:hypothetical protein
MAYLDRDDRQRDWETIGYDTLLALSIATPIALLVFFVLRM